MVPCHSETRFPGGTGHDNTEGSRYTPLHVWFLELCWIGWLWMMWMIYDLTYQIYLKISQIHQAGEEQGNIVGAAYIHLWAMSAYNWEENKK